MRLKPVVIYLRDQDLLNGNRYSSSNRSLGIDKDFEDGILGLDTMNFTNDQSKQREKYDREYVQRCLDSNDVSGTDQHANDKIGSQTISATRFDEDLRNIDLMSNILGNQEMDYSQPFSISTQRNLESSVSDNNWPFRIVFRFWT